MSARPEEQGGATDTAGVVGSSKEGESAPVVDVPPLPPPTEGTEGVRHSAPPAGMRRHSTAAETETKPALPAAPRGLRRHSSVIEAADLCFEGVEEEDGDDAVEMVNVFFRSQRSLDTSISLFGDSVHFDLNKGCARNSLSVFQSKTHLRGYPP